LHECCLIARERLPLRFGDGDLFEETLVMRIRFERLSSRRLSGHIEVTSLAGHAMLALCPVGVGAVAVYKMDELVRFAPAGCSAFGDSTIKQNLDNRDVALEVARFNIGLR
jgi:hypothetical protein